MEIFKLDKPKSAIKVDRLLDVIQSHKDILQYIVSTSTPQYLFWDKVRYKPRPKDISPEEFWELVKWLRKHSPSRAQTIIKDKSNVHFTWQPLPEQDYFLHEVDMQLGGFLESTLVEDQTARRRFISRGIMEEAIASSQLEGANTTRKVAKRMLVEKRRPINKSEQMIMNNYRAMQFVEETLQHKKLDKNTICDLHVMLVQDTIDNSDVGRFRTDRDDVVVCDPASNTVYHIPPPESFLKKEIQRLYKYANDESEKGHFVHPVIKAIILHFWIAYLHPFTDGNGRLARTIFYWYLLKNKYWAFTYLPISRVIKNSAVQYRDAYIYSEQDDNDLTYFIDYNIRKIQQARREFDAYIKRKQIENRKMTVVARSKYHLNDRQIQLLKFLHKNPSATTSIKTHAHVNNISRMTARKDLQDLEQLGFIVSEKIGRTRPFRSTSKTAELFA